MTDEIDALGKAALVASRSWGDGLKSVEAGEVERQRRQRQVKSLLDKARTAKGGDTDPAFFELKEDEKTRLINLEDRSTPVAVLSTQGNLKVPLGGTETLLGQFEKDVELAGQIAKDFTELRKQQTGLQLEVVAMEERFLKQNVIREHLYNEASHLAAFEVNASEQRDTVLRRKRQLELRLVPFRAAPAKPNKGN
jgi:hypothetical protein